MLWQKRISKARPPPWTLFVTDQRLRQPEFPVGDYHRWGYVHLCDPWHNPLPVPTPSSSTGGDVGLKQNSHLLTWVMHKKSQRIFLYFFPEKLVFKLNYYKALLHVYGPGRLRRVYFAADACSTGVLAPFYGIIPQDFIDIEPFEKRKKMMQSYCARLVVMEWMGSKGGDHLQK